MEQTQQPNRNPMATAALVLGVLSLLSILSLFYWPYAIVFASMSIMFALLSRGGSFKMPGKAVQGLAISTFSLVVTIFLLAFSLTVLLVLFDLETILNPEELQKALLEFYNNWMNQLPAGGSLL